MSPCVVLALGCAELLLHGLPAQLLSSCWVYFTLQLDASEEIQPGSASLLRSSPIFHLSACRALGRYNQAVHPYFAALQSSISLCVELWGDTTRQCILTLQLSNLPSLCVQSSGEIQPGSASLHPYFAALQSSISLCAELWGDTTRQCILTSLLCSSPIFHLSVCRALGRRNQAVHPYILTLQLSNLPSLCVQSSFGMCGVTS